MKQKMTKAGTPECKQAMARLQAMRKETNQHAMDALKTTGKTMAAAAVVGCRFSRTFGMILGEAFGWETGPLAAGGGWLTGCAVGGIGAAVDAGAVAIV